MDDKVLEGIYQENLDERIIECLAVKQHIPYEQAMDRYYNSRLASDIYRNSAGKAHSFRCGMRGGRAELIDSFRRS